LRNLQQQRRLRRWRWLFGLLFPRGGQLTCDTFVVVIVVVVVIGWRRAAHHLVTLVDRRAGWRVIDPSEGRARARWQRSNLDRDGSGQRREGSLAVRWWSEVVVHGEEKGCEVRWTRGGKKRSRVKYERGNERSKRLTLATKTRLLMMI
jgi:hypothetical protein